MNGRLPRWLCMAIGLTIAASPLLDSLLLPTPTFAAGTTKSSAKTTTTSATKSSSAKKKTASKSTTQKKSTTTKKSTTKKSTGKAKTGKSISSSKSKSTKKSGKSVSTRKRKSVRRPVVVAFDPARPSTLRAESAVVLDRRTGHVLWGKNVDDQRPVASLTKLMTALVVIESPLAMDDTITVTVDDVTGAGHSRVRAGNRVTVDDLFHCSLISSDNAATRTLARATGLSKAEFVARMNQRARELGMERTHYTETTGLDAGNISTARDQALVLDAAQSDPMIGALLRTQSHSFRCGKRTETLNNTNRLLRSRTDIVSGKTGFTRPAGYCLATQSGDASNPNLTTVVLGAPSNSSRFSESAKLIDWANKSLDPVAGATTNSNRR